MEKDLSTLVRLKKWQVDEAQRTLADLLKKISDIERQQLMLEEHLKSEQKVATENPESLGFAYEHFADSVIKARAQYENVLADLEQKVLLQREVIAEAFREHKTIEQLQTNREERERQDFDRKEQSLADEIAAGVNQRKISSKNV